MSIENAGDVTKQDAIVLALENNLPGVWSTAPAKAFKVAQPNLHTNGF
jgi:hypothetical protein